MLTQEQNDLLTQTGPGTPGGDLLRRYWQPAALAEELPPGGAPLPVRILGEDLVLFRDDAGRPGLLGLHCSHRAADLSYGRVENGGLRCLYHGWLYDVRGRCLEQPGEPAGSTFKDRIRHPAYPCQEAGGIVFTYMGPGEPPLLPAYAFLRVPEDHVFVNKVWHDCNYLQGNEGNIDPVHLSFLHRFLHEDPRSRNTVSGSSQTANALLGRDPAPTIEIEETDFGVRIYTVRAADAERDYVRITSFVMPNLSAFNGETSGERYQGHSINWHVPIDDTHHWKYQIVFSRKAPLDKDQIRQRYVGEMEDDYHLVRNPANRYLQDREEMQTRTFVGVGSLFAAHDAFIVQGEGPVQDRTQEHLGYGDKAIIAARRMLLRAIEDVQAGREPPHVVRDPAANDFGHHVVTSVVVPAATDWRTAWGQMQDRQPVPAQG